MKKYILSILVAAALIASLVVLIQTAQAAVFLSTGLTGYWTYDARNIINGVVRDVSGNGRNANLIGPIASSTFFINGKVFQAAMFDGVNDAADTGVAMSNFLSTTIGSMAVWAYPMAVGAGSCSSGSLAAFMVDKTQGFMWIGMDATNFCLGGGDPGGKNVTSPIVLNKWVHLVWVHTGGQICGYKNGALISCTALGTLGSVTGTLRMGAGYNSTAFPKAKIDDARIYNIALSASDVYKLYRWGLSKHN